MIKSTKNNNGQFSFTLKETNILSEIITECRVSLPFHPLRDHGRPHPKLTTCKALWDTGATNCSITKSFADSIGLKPTTKAQVHHANGVNIKDVYIVNIILPNERAFAYLPLTECESTAGKFDIIIGMQVITQGDFVITNHQGKTTVSFRTPSCVCIDFNDEVSPNQTEVKDEIKVSNKFIGTSRNKPCPCGSGKKYKHCHGLNA